MNGREDANDLRHGALILTLIIKQFAMVPKLPIQKMAICMQWIWQLGFEKRFVNIMANQTMRVRFLKYAPLALLPVICI